MNYPSATATGGGDVEEMVEKIADGLFHVLATLGVVPVIRCPVGGAAEMVAVSLDTKLRHHLRLLSFVQEQQQSHDDLPPAFVVHF